MGTKQREVALGKPPFNRNIKLRNDLIFEIYLTPRNEV